MIILSSILIAILLGALLKSHLELSRQRDLFYREKEAREEILRSLSDGIIQYDERFRIVLMNRRAEEFFGVKFEDLEDLEIVADIWDIKPEYRALVEVLHPELAPFTLSRGGETFSSDKGMEIHTSRPELKLFVVSRAVKEGSDKKGGHIKILRDISHEALLSKIKSEFVSVAAHQLRTPLAALKWSIRLLLDGDAGKLEPKQDEYLTTGYEITQRMIKLVNDLLDAARIEEGRFGYDFKEIDYIDFMQKLVGNYDVVARKQKVNLILSKPEEKISLLYADPERLGVAFSNLIENAMRYTRPDGKVGVKISREGDYIKTTVTDTGIGIPPDEQKRLFSKFFRASNAIKMETEGTGLGLFIVRNIIKRHGGEIAFSSEEGKGTTFTVLLPIKRDLVPNRENPVVEEFLAGI